MKLSAALAGIKIKHKGKTIDALLLNCGPNTLKVMLTEIQRTYAKNNANPLNITELLGVMQSNGIKPLRGPITIDLAVLERAGVITADNTWRETLIKPNYEKVVITIDDEGRTVVKLD